jgi:hypothetical protein
MIVELARRGIRPEKPSAYYVADCDSIARLLLSLGNDAAAAAALQLNQDDAAAVVMTGLGMIGGAV